MSFCGVLLSHFPLVWNGGLLCVFWHTHCGIPVLLSIVVVMVSCYVVLHSECLW